MAKLTTFLPEVMPEVQGAFEPLVINALRNSAIEFCQRAGVWQEDLDPVTLEVDQDEYEFDTDSNSMVKNIVNATQSMLTKVYMKNPRIYVVEPMPTAITITEPLLLKVALKPSLTTEIIDDIVAEDWREYIAAGAKYRLMRMPQVKWSNPALAAFYEGEFRVGVGRAKVSLAKGFNDTEITATTNEFGF